MIRAGLRITTTRYRVIAAGIDHRDRIIAISTNSPRLQSRGWHAEERVMFKCPKYLLNRIVLIRVNGRGERLPIDPCVKCQKLADKRRVKIETL